MKLKEFLEMMNENESVHVAIQVAGVDNCLFAADGAFDKDDFKGTELANYKIVEFGAWHGYFTVVIER